MEETREQPQPETKPEPPKLDKGAARQSGYTGDQCTNCFSMRMRVAGHCMVCEECGTTTGCS
jgi:ribonucleoside-diphosphate reductase alpha chain